MSNHGRPLATVRRPHWLCPSCKGAVIVEVTGRATVHTRIEGLDESGELVFGPHTEIEPGQPQRYECAACGCQVTDGGVPVTTRKALAAFLRGRVVP